MPTVPREENRVGIADATNAKLQPGDYSGTGLQALGAGMQQLGGTGARIAGEMQERQARNDEFEVKKAWNAYAEGARGIRTSALGRVGADPQGMLESMTRDYGGLRDWIRSGLKNDRQRGQFDRVIAERFDYDLSGAVAGAGQALRRGQDQQSMLLERNAADDATDNSDDPVLFDKHLQTGIDSIVARGMARGDDPAAIDRSAMAYGSDIRRRVVQGLTDRDPVAAANRYRLLRDTMTQADRQATEEELFEPLARALAATEVDALLPKRAPDEAELPLTPEQRAVAAQRIEAKDWTEARKQYAREDLAERGLREEQRRKQAADAAKEAAFADADRLGPGFTSITQIPAAIRRDLDEATTTSLARQAEYNLDPAPVAPQGRTALQLQLMATYQPTNFARQDLRLMRNLVAPTEYDAFIRQQQAIGRNPQGGETVSRQRLGGTVDGRISYAPTLASGGAGAPAFLPAGMMQDGGSFAQDRAVALDLAKKRGENPADILRSLKGLPKRPAAEPPKRTRQASVPKPARFVNYLSESEDDNAIRALKKMGSPLGYTIVYSHGVPASGHIVDASRGKPGIVMKARDILLALERKEYKKGTPIILSSCFAANDGEAQELSRLTGGVVYAAKAYVTVPNDANERYQLTVHTDGYEVGAQSGYARFDNGKETPSTLLGLSYDPKTRKWSWQRGEPARVGDRVAVKEPGWLAKFLSGL